MTLAVLIDPSAGSAIYRDLLQLLPVAGTMTFSGDIGMRNCIQNVPRVPAQFLNDCGEDPMPRRESIVILDGARRTLRADIRENNRVPGLFSRFSTTQLGGMAIGATLEHTGFDRSLVGHVVMGTAAHSHRDLICGAQGMRCRGGLGRDVPALTVAGICGRHP